jgi:hypothetical protein
MYYQSGMWMECNNNRLSVNLTGQLLHPVKDDLMPQMDTIKGADRHHRMLNGGKILKRMIDFHGFALF